MNARVPMTRARTEPAYPNMLVIGGKASWTATRGALPQIDGVVFSHFRELTSTLLRDVSPDFVLSPLMDSEFDALDIAAELSRLGYRGRYRAVVASVPNPKAILNEVRQAFPFLDFDILVVPDRPALAGSA
jgi:hypothetical protein